MRAQLLSAGVIHVSEVKDLAFKRWLSASWGTGAAGPRVPLRCRLAMSCSHEGSGSQEQ